MWQPIPRRLDELAGETTRFTQGTFAIAKRSFASFEDSPESHYYQAPELTPAETWDALTAEVGRVTVIAAVEAANGGVLVASDFHLIHRAIFEPVFGDATLAQRQYDEQVTYGVVRGLRSRPEHRRQRGISAKSLPYRLKDLAKDLARSIDQSDEAELRGESVEVFDAVLPAARAYCRFLGYHPYFDGNGRTAFPVLNFVLIRLGLVAVAVPDSEEFHWCLGQGMRQAGRSFDPFARHIEAIIKNSQGRADQER